jgi:Ion channel
MGAGRPITGFYLSIITQLTIGYGDVYPTSWMRLVAAIQGLVGIVFVVLVFGRVIASFQPLKEVFGQD